MNKKALEAFACEATFNAELDNHWVMTSINLQPPTIAAMVIPAKP